MALLFRSFLEVLIGALVISILTFMGWFDGAPTEDGLEHYAEQPWTFSYSYVGWLKPFTMPANTAINFLYTFVGIFWIYRIHKISRDSSVFKSHDVYMYYIFAWMAIDYSFVQLARIITQNHRIAILDQWYTFIIFSWIAAWLRQMYYGFSGTWNLFIVSLSCSSYVLTLLIPFGFEVALAVHISLGAFTGLKLTYDTRNKKLITVWIKVMLSCFGFVALKLLDHELTHVHDVFKYISGHFISKICDCLQFHYAFEFIFTHQMSVFNMKHK